MTWTNKTAEQKYEHLLTRILWKLQKKRTIKNKTESSYSRGYQLGFKELKKYALGLIEDAIEQLKRR